MRQIPLISSQKKKQAMEKQRNFVAKASKLIIIFFKMIQNNISKENHSSSIIVWIDTILFTSSLEHDNDIDESYTALIFTTERYGSNIRYTDQQ